MMMINSNLPTRY